jgi:hypothetical protein
MCVLALTISCKRKEKVHLPIVPSVSHSLILSDGYKMEDVIKKIEANAVSEAFFNDYLPTLPQKKFNVTADSLQPRYWKSNHALSENKYNSIYWGVLKNVVNDGIDTIFSTNKMVEYVNRKQIHIKAPVLIPERGMVIWLDILLAFHYNSFKKKYEYFFNNKSKSNCFTSISAPFIGDLDYKTHEVLNFDDEKSATASTPFDAEGNGIVIIDERRWHYDFDNGQNRCFYPLNAMDISFQKQSKDESATVRRTSENFHLEFDFKLKMPDYNSAHEAIQPLYLLTVKTRYVGFNFN